MRKSVLDSVITDGMRLQQRLGSADRNRVEQHLEAIRAVERRLDTTGVAVTPSACADLAVYFSFGPRSESSERATGPKP